MLSRSTWTRLGILALVAGCGSSDGTRPTGPARPAGAPCDATGCGDGPLLCDVSVRDGFCTNYCRHSASADDERAQCGGAGATCMAYTDDPGAQNALCLPACDPRAARGATGACAEGRLCTGWWIGHAGGRPDAPGCYPYCATDDHCPDGERCNPRTGACGAGVDGARRADGEPCNPSLTAGANTQCRGACFAVSPTDRSRGLCGSFLNLAVTRQCPDSPEAILPLGRAGEDLLGLCVFRRCRTDVDCPAPLRCATRVADPVCDYP